MQLFGTLCGGPIYGIWHTEKYWWPEVWYLAHWLKIYIWWLELHLAHIGEKVWNSRSEIEKVKTLTPANFRSEFPPIGKTKAPIVEFMNLCFLKIEFLVLILIIKAFLSSKGGRQGFWKNVDSALSYASICTIHHLYFNNLHTKWPTHKIWPTYLQLLSQK